MEKSDISREGLTMQKLLHQAHLLRPKNNYAIAKVSEFARIDLATINERFGRNFCGAIVDVCECIATHHGEVLDENVTAIVRMVQQGIRIALFSNMILTDRYRPLIKHVQDQTGHSISVVTSAFAKPDPRGFLEAKAILELAAGEEAVAIGDNLGTDGGSIAAGIPFILVKPIKTAEPFLSRMKRAPQKCARSFHAGLSSMYDFLGRRTVLTDRDFSLSR